MKGFGTTGAIGVFLIGALTAGRGLAAPTPRVHHESARIGQAPVHLVVIPAHSVVLPVVSRPGKRVEDFAASAGALAAINGGYFNYSDGLSVSHVIADGKPLTKPEANRTLTSNRRLKPHLETIWGQRAAWYTLWDDWHVAAWSALPAETLHAVQAGPQLLGGGNENVSDTRTATLALKREGFLLPQAPDNPTLVDSISGLSKQPRSGLGIRLNGDMVWAVVGRPGATIAEWGAFFRSRACVEALNLDGGGSSTLVWQDGDDRRETGIRSARRQRFVGSGKAAAPVCSALLVLPSVPR